MSEWREVALGDLVARAGGFIKTGPFGSQLHAEEYTEDPAGVPVVMPKDMVKGRVARKSVSRVDQTTAERLRAHRLAAGDVVLARRGDIGRFVFIENDEGGWLCGTGAMRVHAPNEQVIWPRFLRYAMAAPRVGEWLVGQAVGATMPNLNGTIVADIPLCVPALSTQRRISTVLGTVDDLIEINERRIELLEDLARALYREWFVRFRFPGHETSRPRTEGTVGEVADLLRQSVHPGKEPTTRFEHFSIPAFDSDRLPIFELGESIKSSKYAVTDDSVLLAKLNPRIARVWFAVPTTTASIASSEFLLWRGASVSNAWLWATFSDADFRASITGAAGGTSTSHQRVSADDVANYGVRIPDSRTLQAFDSFAEPALRKANKIRGLNRALARTRDLLLPRLVTGRLDISDIDLGNLLPDEDAA